MTCLLQKVIPASMAEMLIEKGVDIFQPNSNGQMPLYFTAEKAWPNNNSAILEKLTPEEEVKYREVQLTFRNLFFKMISSTKLHPFQLVPTPSDQKKQQPLGIALSEVSSHAADQVFKLLEAKGTNVSTGLANNRISAKFNYAMSTEYGFDFMTKNSIESVLALLETDDDVTIHRYVFC